MPTSCCIKSCYNNTDKTKHSQISYHRFPKNEELRKKWLLFCENNAVPNTSRICSVHFKKGDFQRDLQRELTGGVIRNILKDNAVPSVLFKIGEEGEGEEEDSNVIIGNIMEEIRQEETNRSIEINKILQEHYCENEHNIVDNKSKHQCIYSNEHAIQENLDNYHEMYLDLLRKHEVLQSKHTTVIEANKTLKKKLRHSESQLSFYKLQVNKEQVIEKKLRDVLSLVLTKNQLNLLLKKKKRINWKPEEISIAFTIRYYSEKCYDFLRQKLNYPLPSPSSLKRWKRNINAREDAPTP